MRQPLSQSLQRLWLTGWHGTGPGDLGPALARRSREGSLVTYIKRNIRTGPRFDFGDVCPVEIYQRINPIKWPQRGHVQARTRQFCPLPILPPLFSSLPPSSTMSAVRLDRRASDDTLCEPVDETQPLLSKFSDAPVLRRTPLPTAQLTVLCLIRLADPIAFTQLFPYVNEMVVRFGIAEPAGTGFYSGLVVRYSSSLVAQLHPLTGAYRRVFLQFFSSYPFISGQRSPTGLAGSPSCSWELSALLCPPFISASPKL